MNRKEIKNRVKWLKRENQKHPDKLAEVPREKWPPLQLMTIKPSKIYRSRFFIVQIFKEGDNIRLSINRTELDYSGKWKDDISWDDLQELKKPGWIW